MNKKMGFLFVTTNELSALMGLPYIQQSTYLLGIRPYMDRETFLVGVKRKISYQQLAEALYIEPHQGFQQSGSPSRQQLRRIIYALERAGLIKIESIGMNLIVKCLLVDTDISVQNKPDTNPTQQPDTNQNIKKNYKSSSYDDFSKKSNTVENTKPDTPHNSENLCVYVRAQFEKFWELYPQKQDETRAFQEFYKLKPDETQFRQMIDALQAQIENRLDMELCGEWVPKWKFPANWLAQQCWNDELLPVRKQEQGHANTQTSYRKKSAADILAESCKESSFSINFEDEPQTGNNVLNFSSTRNV
ncbi:TPA: hypothetical protein JBD88_03940 [Legionella pneumophila subsp. pneumophila]|nr:hypothetical protein DM454_11725 [Legionella pneumophila]HAT8881197.1 hypothetical protein [Legionella pneumophila subsp. pneumophila]PYB48921.1 hypothetical protein DM456_12405 [Legionella pneumophila]PYB62010.1 hypothetical protein DM455_11675 [Legionella pneumophila]TID57975.1 hypothetical protein DIZ40_12830 [Legionella pneumophila]